MKTDHVDLVLLHWPFPESDIKQAWEGLQRAKQKGLTRKIGVSNFTQRQLRSLSGVEMNQVEYHPYLNQEGLLNYCRKNKIRLTAYSPLGRGEILDDTTLKEIGKSHGKTAAQVSLRWLIQKGITVIPKASSHAHRLQNYQITDFRLAESEMKRIDQISRHERFVNPGFAPDWD